jgi:hypothetical protein
MSRNRKTKRASSIERDQRETAVPIAPAKAAVKLMVPLVLLAITFAAFYPALTAEFVNLDDDRLFVENNSYRGFDEARLMWMFTTTFMGHYQPVTWLSSALDYKISGTDPSSYHRNNVILHALNGLLVYLLALRLLAAAALGSKVTESPIAWRFSSLVASLLFAIHPLRVESVAWATERRDVLSTFFLLLGLLAYLRSCQPMAVRLRSRAWYAASLALLVLSLLSKAWGMSFVLIALTLDVYPLRRLPDRFSAWWGGGYRWIWFQKIPFLLLGLGAAVMAGYAQRSAMDTMKTLDEWGVVERIVQSCYGIGFYVWKTVWPVNLAVMYELPYDMNPFSLRFVPPILFVSLAAVLLITGRRLIPGVPAVAAVYVITLAPVLGMVQSGPQLVADRYSYLSCIGWAVLIAGGLMILWRRGGGGRRVLISVATAVAIALLFMSTRSQTETWSNSKSLWEHAMAVSPSSIAFQNYGILLRAEGRVDEAIQHYHRAITIKPDAGNAWFALGNALKQQRRFEEAEQAYLESVKYMTQRHNAYLNLGNLYYNNLRRVDDSIAAFRGGIEYMETHRSKLFNPVLYLALGIAQRQQGDEVGARRSLETAAKYGSTRDRAKEHLRAISREE